MVATAGICAAAGVGAGIVAAGAVGAGLGAVAYQLKDGPKTAEGGFLASALGAVSGIAGIAMVGLKPVASAAAAGIEKATVTAGAKAAPAVREAATSTIIDVGAASPVGSTSLLEMYSQENLQTLRSLDSDRDGIQWTENGSQKSAEDAATWGTRMDGQRFEWSVVE